MNVCNNSNVICTAPCDSYTREIPSTDKFCKYTNMLVAHDINSKKKVWGNLRRMEVLQLTYEDAMFSHAEI